MPHKNMKKEAAIPRSSEIKNGQNDKKRRRKQKSRKINFIKKG